MGCKPILGGLSESQSHDVIVQFPVWRAWPVLSLRSGPGMATGREKTPQTLHAFPSRATGTASDPRRTHNGRSWRRREGTENLQCFFTRFLGSATAARHEPHALERRGLTATPPPPGAREPGPSPIAARADGPKRALSHQSLVNTVAARPCREACYSTTMPSGKVR